MMKQYNTNLSRIIKNRDYQEHLSAIVENNDPAELIAELAVLHERLIEQKHKYSMGKLDYDYKFLNLCTSKAYQKEYKTIKAREQMAERELIDLKKENIARNTHLTSIKKKIELVEWQLQFLLRNGGE